MKRSEFKELIAWYYTWEKTKHMSDSIRKLWVETQNRPRAKIKIYGNGKDLPDLSVRHSPTRFERTKTRLKSWLKKVRQ